MEIGSSTSGVAQTASLQQTRQPESQPRQTELATPESRPVAENNPTPDSRVGSVINTTA